MTLAIFKQPGKYPITKHWLIESLKIGASELAPNLNIFKDILTVSQPSTTRLVVQGVSKKSEFSGNWLRKILLGSVRNPVGIIMTNPALLQYASHFIHHRKCVGYTQIQWNQFSLGFQQTVTRLGHNYIQGVSNTCVHCVFFRQKNKLSQLIRCYKDSQNKENYQK